MKAAWTIAVEYDAKLSIVHVLGTPPVAWEFDYGPYRKSLLESADAQLRHVRRELGIDADVEILEGSVAVAIRECAFVRQADLVVTGRGHAGGMLGRLWSHLYAIVGETPCPVLSI